MIVSHAVGIIWFMIHPLHAPRITLFHLMMEDVVSRGAYHAGFLGLLKDDQFSLIKGDSVRCLLPSDVIFSDPITHDPKLLLFPLMSD